MLALAGGGDRHGYGIMQDVRKLDPAFDSARPLSTPPSSAFSKVAGSKKSQVPKAVERRAAITESLRKETPCYKPNYSAWNRWCAKGSRCACAARRHAVTQLFRWSLRAYRSLLILYPDDLRRDFGPEMLEAFAQDLSVEWHFAQHQRSHSRLAHQLARIDFKIGLPAWLRIPAVAVPIFSAAAAIVSQSRC